jgi:acyl-homoserine lactone acylase PvdQ
MWYGFLRGRSLPGNGNDYTIRLQESGFAQGFRAVWNTRDWDAGGISIPAGESGEVGSPYYDDEAGAWIDGTLVPLPFSGEAIARNTLHVLTLRRGE